MNEMEAQREDVVDPGVLGIGSKLSKALRCSVEQENIKIRLRNAI